MFAYICTSILFLYFYYSMQVSRNIFNLISILTLLITLLFIIVI
nr:MAG TPA: hypothetical protein [Caudoviricetes sp.]